MMERATATAFERSAQSAAVQSPPSKAAPLPRGVDCAKPVNDAMATLLPLLDLRALERMDSSATASSTSAPVDDSDVSSDDLDDEDDVRAYADDRDLGLVKPMSLLPVCPLDDMAVEDAKRRRRSVRQMKKDTHCPDAECLPSPTSQLAPAPRRFTTSQIASGGDVARPPLSAPTLRRDSMAIRQQYWKQLGLSTSRRDLERNTGCRRERHVGVKVQLNDARAKKGASKSLFQIIASWYASESGKNATSRDSTKATATAMATSDSDSATDASLSPRRKGIRFNEEAELFYIPLHTDYSKRQRDCMWHTRTEFITMVERNLEEVYDEMEREYEEQAHAEALECEAMAREEARQRAHEAQLQARAAKAAEAAKAAAIARASPVQQRTPTSSPVSSPPMLALCPIATQIKVTPRARSPHQLRFKYLNHLGINN